jgi:hypothetical protein
MKYMLMFVRSDEAWEALSDEERDYPAIGRWFQEQAQSGRFVGGSELRPARTATTVRWRSGKPVTTDGPFMEAKETIGGYGIFEVPDLDTAVAIAKTFPAKGHAVEVRPIVERE